MNDFNNNLSGIAVILCLLVLVTEAIETTCKVLTLKTLGLAILATVVILAAAFGIYCLVEWLKEKKKEKTDVE